MTGYLGRLEARLWVEKPNPTAPGKLFPFSNKGLWLPGIFDIPFRDENANLL